MDSPFEVRQRLVCRSRIDEANALEAAVLRVVSRHGNVSAKRLRFLQANCVTVAILLD